MSRASSRSLSGLVQLSEAPSGGICSSSGRMAPAANQTRPVEGQAWWRWHVAP
ncbi:hypothetical protein NPIL_298231, partial [Nephila pilipes]